jgi:hypothetical protein
MHTGATSKGCSMPNPGTAAVVLTLLMSQAATPGQTADQPAANDAEPLSLIGCLQTDKTAGVDGYVLVDARPPKASSASTSSSDGTSAANQQSSAGAIRAAEDEGQVTAGTTGTVPRPEGAEATPLRRYRLVAATDVDLRGHTGHTVEIRGTLQPTTSTPAGEPAPREGSGSATSEPTSEMREAVIGVMAVRRVSSGCPQ